MRKTHKRFKIKINTTNQFRQYKRKNTHRKHSHKLIKNKRVMMGGGLPYEKNVELKYELKKPDGALARIINKLSMYEKGIFHVKLSFEGSRIDEDKSPKYSVKSLSGTVANGVRAVIKSQKHSYYSTFDSSFVPYTPDTYKFKLTMEVAEKKFEVNFVVSVKIYEFRFSKFHAGKTTITLYDDKYSQPLTLGNLIKPDDVAYDDVNGITYSSGNTTNVYPYQPDNPSNMIVEEDKTKEQYTFPINKDEPNRSFFQDVKDQMITKITEVYNTKLNSLNNESE